MNAINLIKPITSLTKTTEYNAKIELILSIIGKIDDEITGKKDVKEEDKDKLISTKLIQLVHYIACLVENIVFKSEGINKMDLLVDILKKIKPDILDCDIETIKNMVEYMLSISAIRKIPILQRAMSYSKQIILKLLPFVPLILKLGSLI